MDTGYPLDASRTTTNKSLKRKNMAGGNALGGSYQSRRQNLATDTFTRGGFSLIGAAGRGPIPPPSGVALSRQSRMNFNNVPVRFDATGGNYSDQIQRIAIGGNSAADNARLNATAIGSNLMPPTFGVGAPNLASWSIDEQTALAVAAGFPQQVPDFAIRNQTFANRAGIELTGMPLQKPSYFDSHNPSRERPATLTRGSESDGLFIDQTQSDASNGTVRTTYNPFKAYPFDEAASKASVSTKDTFGANPVAKYTITVAPEAAAYMPGEEFGNMMFMAINMPKVPKPGVNRGANAFGLTTGLPLHSIYSLPVVNYLLHCSQKFPDTFDEITSIERVESSFGFVGFAIAETGANQTRYIQTPTRTKTRNIVLQLAGETKVNNVLGDIAYGHWFGYIVKGVPIEEIFAQNPDEYPSYNIDPSEPNKVEACVARDGSRLSLNPIQIIPWFDRKGDSRYPRTDELAYYDDYGCLRYGKYHEVAFVTDHYTRGDRAFIDRTPFSANANLHSGALRANINVSRGIKS
jgi:hypothetical protein